MKALLLLLAILSLAEGKASGRETPPPPPDPAADKAEATLAQKRFDLEGNTHFFQSRIQLQF